MTRQARHIKRRLPEADRQKYRKLREQLEGERPDILAEGRRRKAAHDALVTDLREAFRLLKAERLAQGLSLADMRDRTGIGRAALSRLENDDAPNPTVATLMRCAEALGKKLTIRLADRD